MLLLALSFIVFTLLQLTPGDPARNLLGPRSSSPEALAEIRDQYHFNEPFLRQYLLWLGGVFKATSATRIRSDEPVTTLLGEPGRC